MAKSKLEKYNTKRDFAVTSEPRGETKRRQKDEPCFVVQKHDARRLHYDFRLEWDGVLLSWAVPKGPSYYPKNKRLAVRTEDHPVSYGDFEGIIPANQYGAGAVMVWDTGTWTPLEEDVDAALSAGKIHFRLDGEKLHGEWTLARMGGKDEGRENWLLMKNQDADAAKSDDESFLKETDFSAKTGRKFKEITADKPATAKKGTPRFKQLEAKYKAPQLATLVEAPPEGDNWVHEVKYDGYRILVYFINGEVRIRTRRGHDWTDQFPVLKDAFAKLEAGSFVIDGEAVVLDKSGISSFKSLQNALGKTDVEMQGYFFDLLYWNGENYLDKEFQQRREALEKLFEEIPEGPLFMSETIEGDANKVIGKACDMGLEGLISKRLTAKYVQKRAKSWVKSKCEQRQEFIICGFIPASDMPQAIGALHLGYYQDNKLTHAGKVGTGFDHATAKDLFKRLKKLAVKNPPFDEKPDGRLSDTVWVKPSLLCEVKFGMWTEAGKVRHASYQGLREDKAPETIVKEKQKKMTDQTKEKKKRVKNVTISNADREIFPQARITKGGLAEFYAAMDEDIMQGIKDRPLSVVRCPGGIEKQCFFQRSKGKGMPAHIHPIDIEHDGKSHEYFYVKNITGLVELVQMGGVELHGWGVQIDKTERPDRIVFDLDPDEGIPFEAIKLAAQDIKQRLDALELTSFLKCTGGKGLHVTIPLVRRHDWDTVKDFAHNFADNMVRDVPDAYTANMSKKKRKGKIFIDYLRNDFAATAVIDYCVRARTGAPVAVPLAWDELDGLEAANQFTLRAVLDRKKNGKLFTYPTVRQSLTKGILEEVT